MEEHFASHEFRLLIGCFQDQSRQDGESQCFSHGYVQVWVILFPRKLLQALNALRKAGRRLCGQRFIFFIVRIVGMSGSTSDERPWITLVITCKQKFWISFVNQIRNKGQMAKYSNDKPWYPSTQSHWWWPHPTPRPSRYKWHTT